MDRTWTAQGPHMHRTCTAHGPHTRNSAERRGNVIDKFWKRQWLHSRDEIRRSNMLARVRGHLPDAPQVHAPGTRKAIIEQAKKSLFCLPPHNPRPLSGASTDLLRYFAIDYSNYRGLFYIYRRVVVGKKKPIGLAGKEIQLFGFGGEFCPMTAPPTPLMILHPKGGLPASRTCSHYSMAPPIKQENLPAMEDCRLLLKNAVDIRLKGLVIISRRDGARCFLGQCVRG
jgi:hypothetical protein